MYLTYTPSRLLERTSDNVSQVIYLILWKVLDIKRRLTIIHTNLKKLIGKYKMRFNSMHKHLPTTLTWGRYSCAQGIMISIDCFNIEFRLKSLEINTA